MSLKFLMNADLVGVMLVTMAAVVAPGASAHHNDDPTACTCSANLTFAKPSLQWNGEQLLFIPRVNFSIRARGGSEAPPLNVAVNYEGETSYESEDVAAPDGASFNGSKPILSSFPCNGSFRSSGESLTPVPLSGLVRSLLGHREDLDGVVRMKASIEGCGFDEEHRQFSFRMREFGNLFVRGWRSVR